MDYVWRHISAQKEGAASSSSSSAAGSSNVRVAIRMRPLNQRERDLHASQCVSMLTGEDLRIRDDETTMQNKFSFDYCFDANCSDGSESFAGNQQQVFDKLGLEVLTNAWNGYNASLFAYGQTGSGKSYSMMGSDADPGIIPRVCMALFYLIRRHYETVEGEPGDSSSSRQFSVEASYLEIYNERIRDLLDPGRAHLKVREHPQTGVFVENLSTCAVQSYKDVSDLLEMGLQQRTTASTNMNSESSRSHSVFTIVIRMQSLLASGKTAVRLCQLCLVDLAGSERAASTGATGARLKEGANINRSLSTLGRCISALAKAASAERDGDKISIPFRESVLTWLLRESLCGNAKTAMLATVSPADVNYGETLSTLRYANSAKMIATKAVVNEDPTTKIINELRNEVLRLREELGGGGGGGSAVQRGISGSGSGEGGGGGGGDGGAAAKKMKERMKEHLLMAEDALQTYAKAWESKEVSCDACCDV
jgi:kinesin family member 1